MSTSLTIKIKNSNLKFLKDKSESLKINADVLVNKALEEYFYFEQLKELRDKLKNIGVENGFLKEQDYYDHL